MHQLRVPSAIVLIAVAALANAQSEELNHSSHYWRGFFGQSAIILGSEDVREAFGLGYGYGRPEPRLRRGSVTAQLVYEGYYEQSSSVEKYDVGHLHTYSFGVLGYGRWFWPKDKQGRGMFFDLGWGFQYANQSSHDLDSQVNSTPTTGFGATFPVGERDFLIGLSLLHISNGGTKKPNRGQNQLLVTFGVRF